MSTVRALLSSLGCLAAMASAHAAGTIVYVSSADAQEIAVLSLDRASGELKPIENVAVGERQDGDVVAVGVGDVDEGRRLHLKMIPGSQSENAGT